MKEAEKIKKGKAALEFNKLDVVYVTGDGTAFAAQNGATNHGSTLEDKSVLKVVKTTEPAKVEKKKVDKVVDPDKKKDTSTVELRTEAINTAMTVDDVDKLLKGESSKSVKNAATARIHILTTITKINESETVEAIDELIKDEDSKEVLSVAEIRKGLLKKD